MTAGPSILVVEDNPTTRKMLRVALVTEGYGVVEAADARAALAAAEKTLPDLVLQDLILPDMDGLELLRRLRALPGGNELPILALSGFLSRLEEAQTDQDGFTALLVKPIEPSRLIDAIGIYLPELPALATSCGEGRRLLVVDDEPAQLKLTRIHFSQLGFDVSAASNASDAMIAARAHRPDVILSDVFMPGSDGFDLCLEIRRDPTLATVPVVLLSAQYGSKANEVLARRVGANALVLRTPDFGHVAPAILEALRTRAPTAAEQPSDQLALRHARLVIHQLEHQAAATAGLAQRCGIQAGQLSLLSGVADALTRKADPDVALRDVLAATLDAAGISKGALMLRDATGVLELRQNIGFSDAERSKLQRFFGHGALLDDIVNRGGSVPVPSQGIPDDTSRDILAGANIASAQIVPLISDGRGVGAMVIGATSRDVTSDDAVAFARAMGNQVVQSLDLARYVARLSASEERYRTLLEGASDFIAVLTPDGIVQEVNHRWVELTGLPREQLIGRHLRGVAPSRRKDEDVQIYNEAAPTSGVPTSPVEIVGSHGSSVFIELSRTNVEVGGERLVFTIGRDVTERQQAEAQLRLQGAALNAAANAMVITDRAGVIEWVNPAFSDLTGYTGAEAVGKNPRDLVKSNQHDQAFFTDLWNTILSGQVWHGEMINRRKDDSLYTEEQTITPLRDGHGVIRHFIGVKQDVTERKRAEEELRERAQLSVLAATVGLALADSDTLAHAVQRCSEALVMHLGAAFAGIWILDDRDRVLELQASAGPYTHLNGPLGRVPLGQFKIGRIALDRKPHLTNTVIGDSEVPDQDWARREGMVAFAGHPLIVDSRVVGVMAIFARHALSEPLLSTLASAADHIALGIGRQRIVEALRTSEERTRSALQHASYSAEHDYLTGLPNRMLLNDRITEAIALARRHRKKLAVLFLDLDGFKHINDSLGHPIGDKVLQSVATRLVHCIRASDTVSRHGGDEFVVLLSEAERSEDAAVAAMKMLQAISEAHSIDQQIIHVTMSIGVSVYPDDGLDAQTLIKNADTAMYHSKDHGLQKYQFFTSAMNVRAVERQFIEEGLRLALSRGEFTLAYQAKVDLSTRQISGAEALIRWTHQVRGPIQPLEFIPVAEDCGLIVPIGRWVLGEACRQTRAWLDAGLPALTVAVNVSAIEFLDENFLNGVFAALADADLNPESLELELTESVLMRDAGSTEGILKALRARGVQLAVDDFGTGYSSLSYLRKFTVDSLKIDQSFIRQIISAPDEPIVRAVIDMGRSLNLRVVAEGVEQQQEAAFLEAHRCHEAQGYYFSRPLPPGQFEELLVYGPAKTVGALRAERIENTHRADRRVISGERRNNLVQSMVIALNGSSVVDRRVSAVERRRSLVGA